MINSRSTSQPVSDTTTSDTTEASIRSHKSPKRKKLYIREVTESSAAGRVITLHATWHENGEPKHKSLGRKVSTTDEQDGNLMLHELNRYGIFASEHIEFLESMFARGFIIAN